MHTTFSLLDGRARLDFETKPHPVTGRHDTMLTATMTAGADNGHAPQKVVLHLGEDERDAIVAHLRSQPIDLD